MKTKIIVDSDMVNLEDRINKFIEGKKVIDIKFTEWNVEGSSGNSALVIYE